MVANAKMPTNSTSSVTRQLQQRARSLSRDIAFNINMIAAGANLQSSNVIRAGDLAAQGSLFAAAGYRQAADLVSKATLFNLSVDALNTVRTLNSISSDYRLISGKQIAQQAATNLSVGSKSFDLVRQETLQSSMKKILDAKIDAENVRRSKVFESDIQRTNLENQAIAAEYQASVDKELALMKAREIGFGAVMQISSLQRQINNQVGSLF